MVNFFVRDVEKPTRLQVNMDRFLALLQSATEKIDGGEIAHIEPVYLCQYLSQLKHLRNAMLVLLFVAW